VICIGYDPALQSSITFLAPYPYSYAFGAVGNGFLILNSRPE
jgi:hypothetical protein